MCNVSTQMDWKKVKIVMRYLMRNWEINKIYIVNKILRVHEKIFQNKKDFGR